MAKNNCKLGVESIGGYFGLELRSKEFHKDAIRLNTGRNALEYILLANSYKKYLPCFTCNVLLEPIKKLNIQVVFYSINKSLNQYLIMLKLNMMKLFYIPIILD